MDVKFGILPVSDDVVNSLRPKEYARYIDDDEDYYIDNDDNYYRDNG